MDETGRTAETGGLFFFVERLFRFHGPMGSTP